MKTRTIDTHHDGHGLNEVLAISADAQDPKAGGASHTYHVEHTSPASVKTVVGSLQFQHGPRNVQGSQDGLTEAAVLAILIDRLRGFQDGEFKCRENAIVLTHLEEALMWVKERAHARAKRGVLGKNEK